MPRYRYALLLGLFLGLGACSSEADSVEPATEGVASASEAPKAAEAGPSQARRPVKHVVIFLADTLRADHVPPNTEARLYSPALHDFAQDAVVFDNAYATSNWTKPSVASLFTGKTPRAHGALNHEAVLGDELLLSERLDAAGFYTAGVITNGYISSRYGFGDGWDRSIHSTDTGKSRGDYVAAAVARVLRERPKDAPLFLYVHTTDVHSPYAAPASDVRRYDPAPYSGPVRFAGRPKLLDDINAGLVSLGPRDETRLVALYAGAVTYHDRQFGKVMRSLERAGILEDALVIFTADHGEELFDHGAVSHAGIRLHEELVRIPMIMRWPGAEAARIETEVSLLDIVPTVLEAVGLPAEPSLPGRSLLAPSLETRPVLLETQELAGIIDGGMKLIWRRGPGTKQLFDLNADPLERTDLSTQRPEEVERLLGMIRAREAAVAAAAPRAVVELDEATQQRLRELGYIE